MRNNRGFDVSLPSAKSITSAFAVYMSNLIFLVLTLYTMSHLSIVAIIVASVLAPTLDARHISPARNVVNNVPRQPEAPPAPKIKTSSGTVRGNLDAQTGISAYLGIPYARPPVDTLRWKAPERYVSDADIDATK